MYIIYSRLEVTCCYLCCCNVFIVKIRYAFTLEEVSQYISSDRSLTFTLKEGESVRIPFKDSSTEDYCYGHYFSKCGESSEPVVVENCVSVCNVRKEDAGKL